MHGAQKSLPSKYKVWKSEHSFEHLEINILNIFFFFFPLPNAIIKMLYFSNSLQNPTADHVEKRIYNSTGLLPKALITPVQKKKKKDLWNTALLQCLQLESLS